MVKNNTFDVNRFVKYARYYEDHPGVPNDNYQEESIHIGVRVKSCQLCGMVHSGGHTSE